MQEFTVTVIVQSVLHKVRIYQIYIFIKFDLPIIKYVYDYMNRSYVYNTNGRDK